MLTNGQAFTIVNRDSSIAFDNGSERWRRLYRRYTPPSRVRHLGSLQKIISWHFRGQHLEQDLTEWEAEMESYVQRTGSQALTDEIKISILVMRLPTVLKEH